MTTQDDTILDTEISEKVKIQKPKRYAVIFHNDDFTSMDFVVLILMTIFHKDQEEAASILLKVHLEEWAIVDIYTKEIAEEKVDTTMKTAEVNGYPLVATFEVYDDE